MFTVFHVAVTLITAGSNPQMDRYLQPYVMANSVPKPAKSSVCLTSIVRDRK
jgi:hypothetical protein